MKKAASLSLIYAIAAMVGGVFYREFTKFSGFTGITTLSLVHTHLFMLGMFLFLLVLLLNMNLPLEKSKQYAIFMRTYNIGLPLTAMMLLVRGIFQVQGTALSKGMDAAISGVAGLGHILLGVGIIFLLVGILKSLPKTSKA